MQGNQPGGIFLRLFVKCVGKEILSQPLSGMFSNMRDIRKSDLFPVTKNFKIYNPNLPESDINHFLKNRTLGLVESYKFGQYMHKSCGDFFI